MNKNLKISVANITFSNNKILKDELNSLFDNISYNENSIRLENQELTNFIGTSDVLIMGLEKLTENILKNCPNLRYIIKFGVGIDNIDFDLLNKFGIVFFHELGVNKFEVAEFAYSQILNLSRNISLTNSLLRNGIWKKDGGKSLSESNIGVIGVGNIGSTLINSFLRSSCKKIYCYDIDVTKYSSLQSFENIFTGNLDELCSQSDIVTIHIPGEKINENYLSQPFFDKLKDGVKILNISRGSLTNQEQLLNNVISGKIHSVALDVYNLEPFYDSRFLSNSRIICTPHIAGNSNLSVLKMGYSVINLLKKNLLN